MAQIVINEVSQNYTFNMGTNSYATVALPITSCWGPGYFDPVTYYGEGMECESLTDYMLEHTAWARFPATQQGLEAFVSAYRGPSSVYRRAKDYSYQMAMTLLTSGYDVLVCRLSPGLRAEGTMQQGDGGATIAFKAKYPGSFGNNLQIAVKKNIYFDTVNRKYGLYWNIITSIVDASGVKTSAENISLVFNVDNSTDTILHYSEVESDFWDITVSGDVDEGGDTKESLNDVPIFVDPNADIPQGETNTKQFIQLSGGTDIADGDKALSEFKTMIEPRFKWAEAYNLNEMDANALAYSAYVNIENMDGVSSLDQSKLNILYYKEWLYTALVAGTPIPGEKVARSEISGVFDLLKDKLAYNPQRVIASGWDDQHFLDYTATGDDGATVSSYIISVVAPSGDCPDTCLLAPSPIHLKLMDVGYFGRCATALLDIPHIVDRKYVHIEDEFNVNREGYTQKLARVIPKNAEMDVNGSLFHTHSALFAPWAQYTYLGTSKMNEAAPSFLALMIQRAQILNQAIQYEWALPTNRKHSLKIGKVAYNVPKKLLDKWQKLEGASLNVITAIPDLGTNLWGNSTLFEVPPSTYQALANLSTRYLVNAIEDVAYRVGIGITFQYNNDQAYNKFYAGVTPILDTMKNVGAIDQYYVRMSSDLNGLDQVNYNTVVGKIYLVINGVINDIIVDLVCLPPGTDLNQYVR